MAVDSGHDCAPKAMMRRLVRLVSHGSVAVCIFALAGTAGGTTAPPDKKADAPAQDRAPVEVKAFVDKAVATTGDEITYTVEVEYRKGTRVEIPEIGAEIAGLRVVDSKAEKPKDLGDRIVERRVYYLRADLVGSYVLPGVTVKYKKPDSGEEESVSSSKIFIEVESVLPKDGAAKDIKDIKPVEAPRYGMATYLWLAGLLGTLLLAALIVLGWGLKKRRGKEPPVALPHELAYSELEKLRTLDFEDPGNVRVFHFRLSEILREYIEARFGLNATDMTSREILAASRELGELDNGDRVLLRSFLLETDAVKFAGKIPSEQEIEERYEEALQFIQHTAVVTKDSGEGAGQPVEGTNQV